MIIQNAEREDHEMDKRESGEDGCMAQKFSTWGQKKIYKVILKLERKVYNI